MNLARSGDVRSHAVGMGGFEYENEYDKGFEDRMNPGPRTLLSAHEGEDRDAG